MISLITRNREAPGDLSPGAFLRLQLTPEELPALQPEEKYRRRE
jgi:hypothetical protein